MATFAQKTLTIATGSVILDFEQTTLLPERISPHPPHNFVSISTATSPTAGDFTAFVELVPDGGFHEIEVINGTGNSIPATNTGAEVADGDAQAWSFNGNANRVKVVATGVTGVTSVEVIVTMNTD